jgi:hypothetical protein
MVGISSIYLSLMPLVIAQGPRKEDDLSKYYTPIPKGNPPTPIVNPPAEAPIPRVETTSPPGINWGEFGRRLSIPDGGALFVQQKDGSYKREFAGTNGDTSSNKDTSVWWVQGKELYCEGGHITVNNENKGIVTKGVYYLSGKDDIAHRNEDILPWTKPLAGINAFVSSDGYTYRVNGIGLAHHLVLNEPGQPPGRIWRADHQLYVNGVWTPCATAPKGIIYVGTASTDGRTNIVPSEDTNPAPWLVVKTESGRHLRFRPGNTDIRVFEHSNNSWIELTNRYGYYHNDKQVSGALQTYRRAPYVTPPQSYTADFPDLDTRISTAKTALTNSGATNIQVSNRFLFNQSTLLPDAGLKDIVQTISYTQGVIQKHKVIVSVMNGNAVNSSREYEFTRKDLQRIANNHSIQISNWDDPNELINLISAHFAMDRHPRASTFRIQELQKQLAQTNSSIQDRTQRRSPQSLDLLCDELAYDTIELECWNLFNNNETIRKRFNNDANAFWWTVYQPNCARFGSFGRLIPREFDRTIYARVPQFTEANLTTLRAEILKTATTATIRTTSPYE